jgi:two-component system, LytTR family, sensor kinase
MSKRRIGWIHLFVWLFAIFANLLTSGFGKDWSYPQFFTYVVAFLYLMLVFYLFYLFILPIFLNRKNLTGFFAVSFAVVLTMPFIGYILLYTIRALFEGTFAHFMEGYSFRMHMSGFYPVLTAAIFGSFFRIIISWFTQSNQKAELEKHMLTAELELLKSKLNPHFLFNTLNNIDSLIPKNPEAASAALIRLSEIMRYLTYETVSDRVTLEKETEYIRNLIELYRLRIKSPGNIRFEAEGDLRTEISPALFVPLIENALKYASFGNTEPSVILQLTSMNGIVVFSASNTVDLNTAASTGKNSGYGLINLKKRLELAYPGKYQLKIDQVNQKFIAELTIDTHAD